MKRLPEQTPRNNVITCDVITPMDSVKAYVIASRAYHANETPELARALLHARARVLTDDPFSTTAEVIRSNPLVDKALALKAGIEG